MMLSFDGSYSYRKSHLSSHKAEAYYLLWTNWKWKTFDFEHISFTFSQALKTQVKNVICLLEVSRHWKWDNLKCFWMLCF